MSDFVKYEALGNDYLIVDPARNVAARWLPLPATGFGYESVIIAIASPKCCRYNAGHRVA